jgi:uncharacterized protein YgiM (DUF1202 family)
MAFTKQRWVIGGLVVVGVLLLISEHSKQSSDVSSTGGARSCTVTVTADVLNARSRPDGNAPVIDTYRKGEVVSANRTTQNGFRQLREDRWVAQEFVQPTPGSDCG